jgi:DNA replication and repair protein RecF
MHIKELQVKDLRIIEYAEVTPAPGINLIAGDNGAGKTSLLEAIYLLGRGKSFRHRDSGPFIRSGSKHSFVLADLVKDDGNSSRLGVERGSASIRVKQDGKEVLKRSILLRALPLQIIVPKSHELIEKGPESRRNFIDYGMFHVEHGYLEQLSEYSRALKQRNAALRSSELDVARSYNPVLSVLAHKIHQHRESYMEMLGAYLTLTLEEFSVVFPVELELNAGMDIGETLEHQLGKREKLDLKRGYTSIGIHRADLVIRSDQALAAHRLSRGQQKILVYALNIAQSRVFQYKTDMLPILMVDDLTAELDRKHLGKVMQLFEQLALQVFITLLSADQIDDVVDTRLFHVEHGKIIRT